MSSLFLDIEKHVHDIGGSHCSIRHGDNGAAFLIVAFLYDGLPRAALIKVPNRQERKNIGGILSGIAKAIT